MHCLEVAANSENNWIGWESLGGSILPGFTVGQNRDGRLEVFAVNRTNGAVDRIFQVITNGHMEWSSWLSLGGNVKTGIAAGNNADGRLEVFAVNGGDATLLHRWQLKPDSSDASGNWSSW